MKGFFGGLIFLTLLQAVLGTEGAAQRLGSTATTAADWLNHLIDPNVPLIPNRAGVSEAADGQLILAN